MSLIEELGASRATHAASPNSGITSVASDSAYRSALRTDSRVKTGCRNPVPTRLQCQQKYYEIVDVRL
jgi:hypothetical protein